MMTEDMGLDTELEMQDYVAKTTRRGEFPISFRGVLIGEASSEESARYRADEHGDLLRWTVIRIYRTEGGGYVLTGEGHTEEPGESTRYWALASETVDGVLENLHRFDRDGVRFLPYVHKQAIEMAATNDSAFQTGLGNFTQDVR